MALFESGRAVVLQHFGALVGGVLPFVVHAVRAPPELQPVDLSTVTNGECRDRCSSQ